MYLCFVVFHCGALTSLIELGFRFEGERGSPFTAGVRAQQYEGYSITTFLERFARCRETSNMNFGLVSDTLADLRGTAELFRRLGNMEQSCGSRVSKM